MNRILSREKTVFVLILSVLTVINVLVFFYTQQLLDSKQDEPAFSVPYLKHDKAVKEERVDSDKESEYYNLNDVTTSDNGNQLKSGIVDPKTDIAQSSRPKTFNPSLYTINDDKDIATRLHFNAFRPQHWSEDSAGVRSIVGNARIANAIGQLPDHMSNSGESVTHKAPSKLGEWLGAQERKLWAKSPFRYHKDAKVKTRLHHDTALRGGSSSQLSPIFVAIGTSQIIRRDFDLLQKSYADIGATVQQGAGIVNSRRGVALSNLRVIRRGEANVVLCLSLDTSKCLSQGEFKTLEAAGDVMINRILDLKDVLWDKGKLCETVHIGKLDWLIGEFTFPCWVLPRDFDDLFPIASSKELAGSSWIVKPLKMGGGKGIFVVDGYRELETKAMKGTHIVQPYLPDPSLIGGKKWDLRTYVLVTSVVPMRVYIYSDGLARFATGTYNETALGGGKRNEFLTNTSVNKHSNRNMSAITWSFPMLEKELIRKTLDSEAFTRVRHNIESSLAMMMLCAEVAFEKLYSTSDTFRCSNCYHLLGVDFILDSAYNARIIEVNGEPSMKLSNQDNSQYDKTKIEMQKDLAHLVFVGDKSEHGRVWQILLGDIRRVVDHYEKQGLSVLNVLSDAGNDEYENRSGHNLRGGGEPASTWDQIVDLVKDPRYVEYLLENRSEQSAMGSYRRVYPSPWPLVGPTRLRERWKKMINELNWSSQRKQFHSLTSALEQLRLLRCWDAMDRSIRQLALRTVPDDCTHQLRDALVLLGGET